MKPPGLAGCLSKGLQEAIWVALGGAPTLQNHVRVQTRTQIQQNPDFALGWALEAVWEPLWAALGILVDPREWPEARVNAPLE